MKSDTTLDLAHKVAELTQLCAQFQARFGRYYALKPGSSADAWALYHQILNQQVDIALLLDPQALEQPHDAYDRWWERQDTLDLSVAKVMLQQVGHVIATCAYHEKEADDGAVHDTEWSYAVFRAESAIAGMLHPSARQVALAAASTAYGRYAG
ncbi:MAG: hypothetical protein H7Y11_04185 [Armatimonadetes bacterium]|nr:hypothetical protein [Anaerolineae bacterium]